MDCVYVAGKTDNSQSFRRPHFGVKPFKKGHGTVLGSLRGQQFILASGNKGAASWFVGIPLQLGYDDAVYLLRFKKPCGNCCNDTTALPLRPEHVIRGMCDKSFKAR